MILNIVIIKIQDFIIVWDVGIILKLILTLRINLVQIILYL